MTVNLKVLVGQIVFLFLVFSLSLFFSAGTIVWLAGWVFVCMN
jgi:hypothetical protein